MPYYYAWRFYITFLLKNKSYLKVLDVVVDIMFNIKKETCVLVISQQR